METKGDKLVMKGRLRVFSGYPQGTKGYKIFDIKCNKMMVSRDVKFIENLFPFSNEKTKEEELFSLPVHWVDENITYNKDRPRPNIEEQ
jgi:hypothetical protein